MKELTTLFLLIALSASAQIPFSLRDPGARFNPGASVAVAESATYLINQNFEGSGSGGWDNSETWTGIDLVVSNATDAILRGSYSCKLDPLTVDANAYSPAFAVQSNLFTSFRFMFSGTNTENARAIFVVETNTVAQLTAYLGPANVLQLKHGSDGTKAGTFSLTSNTLWYVWVDYTTNSAPGVTDGWGAIYCTNSTTKPANPYISTTTGTASNKIDRVRIHSDRSATCFTTNWFDQVLVDDVDIGNITP